MKVRYFWQYCYPSIISVTWEVSRGSDSDYIKGSCYVFCELDISGARVDDKCDSSCRCGMPGLRIVLLIEWSVSSYWLWAIKLLHHCWFSYLNWRKQVMRIIQLTLQWEVLRWTFGLCHCDTDQRFKHAVFSLFQAYDVIRVASFKDEVAFWFFCHQYNIT